MNNNNILINNKKTPFLRGILQGSFLVSRYPFSYLLLLELFNLLKYKNYFEFVVGSLDITY